MVLYKNDSISGLHFSVFTGTTDTFTKNKRCHMILEGFSGFCANLEPASSKNNEILEIKFLQKVTSHALYSECNEDYGKWLGI